jgi:hypothetical protein
MIVAAAKPRHRDTASDIEADISGDDLKPPPKRCAALMPTVELKPVRMESPSDCVELKPARVPYKQYFTDGR